MQARRFEQSERANLDIVPFLLTLYGTGDNEMLKSRVLNMVQEKDEWFFFKIIQFNDFP